MTCDVGIKQVVETRREPRADAGPLRILWSGDLEPRKALSLLLKALAKLPSDVAFELRVLGEGRMERRLKRLAAKLGIDTQYCVVRATPVPRGGRTMRMGRRLRLHQFARHDGHGGLRSFGERTADRVPGSPGGARYSDRAVRNQSACHESSPSRL